MKGRIRDIFVSENTTGQSRHSQGSSLCFCSALRLMATVMVRPPEELPQGTQPSMSPLVLVVLVLPAAVVLVPALVPAVAVPRRVVRMRATRRLGVGVCAARETIRVLVGSAARVGVGIAADVRAVHGCRILSRGLGIPSCDVLPRGFSVLAAVRVPAARASSGSAVVVIVRAVYVCRIYSFALGAVPAA